MSAFVNHLGLDIGTESIKVVQLSSSNNERFNLVAIGMIKIPEIEPLMMEHSKVEAIKKLFGESNITLNKVVVSLPESAVYTRVIEMPSLDESEMASAIRWQAEQYIPVPLSEVVLKHQTLTSPSGSPDGVSKVNVLLVAAPNEVISSIMSLTEKAGLECIAIETEILAVARALVGVDKLSPASLLIHFGSDSTTISILRRGDLSLSQTIGTAGKSITRAVATEFGLEFAQAEEYKKIYGLDPSKFDGKVAAVIRPIIDLLVAEIKRALAYYDSRWNSDKIKRFVLSGGGALLPGIVPILSEEFAYEIQLGDPFLSINLTDGQRKEIGENGPIFSPAIGLAMKSV